MTDEIVNSGFGYTTDEVDTSKFTKEELNLWFNLVDNETYYDLIMDYDGYFIPDEDVCTVEISNKDYSFTFLPDCGVVDNRRPVHFYTTKEACDALIKHTRVLFKTMLKELGKDEIKDKELFNRANTIVDKMNIPAISHYQDCVGY